ncbi:MAG TPA: histidine phosphatase family protein [Aestuariivirga sp.]|nr:histidine phosphatase family protein [Aestuariivirga sp.]
MLNLMLLRHAKSSWAETGQADLDRPLNERGKRAAAAMGSYLAANSLVPQRVLCSPARRTKETWDLVAAELPGTPEVLVAPEIYDFSGGKALMECLRHKAGAANSVLLVGHNPSIAGLAQTLVGAGNGKLRQRLDEKYPTAALAVISFDLANWESLSAGAGTLQRFVTPRDIIDDD